MSDDDNQDFKRLHKAVLEAVDKYCSLQNGSPVAEQLIFYISELQDRALAAAGYEKTFIEPEDEEDSQDDEPALKPESTIGKEMLEGLRSLEQSKVNQFIADN